MTAPKVIKNLALRSPSLRRWYYEVLTTVAGLWPWLKFQWIKACSRLQTVPKYQIEKAGPLRLAFVSTWFGKDIAGGAENLCYHLAHAVKKHSPEVQIEVFTTTLKEFSEDWNREMHQPGAKDEDGLLVHRFPILKRDRKLFHWLNGTKLMQGGTANLKMPLRSPVNRFQETFFLTNMIESPGLNRHLRQSFQNHDFFIYLPYMFRSTVLGGLITAQKSIVIPCFHDERYAFMSIYRQLMKKVRATFFNTASELKFAKDIFQTDLPHPFLLGVQVEPSFEGDAARFKAKFKIQKPFMLYAGRIIEGKNVPDMVEKFLNFKKSQQSDLVLVLIGKGDVDAHGSKDIFNLGFVSEQDKCDAYAAASFLCQPSLNESFSIVMMESWLQKTPVLAHAHCEVTRDHCLKSEAGLVYSDQDSFNQALLKLTSSWRDEAGQRGRDYVLKHYSSKTVTSNFLNELHRLRKMNRGGELS